MLTVKAHRKIAPFTSRLIARTLTEADRRLEHHKRFVKRMEDSKLSSIQRLNDLPTNATHETHVWQQDIQQSRWHGMEVAVGQVLSLLSSFLIYCNLCLIIISYFYVRKS